MGSVDIKIENTQKAIDKLEKKIGRIKVALETGKNPYYYDESDLRRAFRELAEAQKKLDGYKDKKASEERVEIIPVIEVFLEAWKQKAIEWYKQDYQRLIDYIKEYKVKQERFNQWKIDNFKYSWTNNVETKAKEKELGIDYETYRKDMKNRFSNLTVSIYQDNNWKSKIEELMEREKVNKRKLLIARVKEITGEITDARGLYIAGNAEINGLIIGKEGSARVETISAGGWNIQCFHYRVLVKKVQ